MVVIATWVAQSRGSASCLTSLGSGRRSVDGARKGESMPEGRSPSTVHTRMNGAIRGRYRYDVSPLVATMSRRIERPRSLASSVAYANMRLGYRVLQSLGDILQFCNIQPQLQSQAIQCAKGKLIRMLNPPSVDSFKEISPPWALTICRAMESPRPLPPV